MFLYTINASITLCYFPMAWKEAKVVAVPKPGKPRKQPASYRPISLLSALSKVAERIMHKKLLRKTAALRVLPAEQFGFRPGRGSPEQLLKLLTFIAKNMDERAHRSTMLVALDLTKAFDTIWHEGLIYKLAHFGFPEWILKWTHSYLSGRSMRVHSHGVISLLGALLYGVPQGSVMGPLYYILYTADMPMLPFVFTGMFADDLARATRSKTLVGCLTMAQRAINVTTSYYDMWRLIINPAKTQVTIFNSRGTMPPPPLEPLSLKLAASKCLIPSIQRTWALTWT